jgi:L-ascorbate metabolism protein UlaG (beta-lactamase superfamily)
MRRLLFAFMLLVRVAVAGLEDYPHLLVADAAPAPGGIRITYLGVHGYQFEHGGHTLLVDPYFSRLGAGTFLLDREVAPDAARLEAGLAHVRPRVDAVLVTHAHVDHLLDVPPIMRRTGARLLAGPTAVNQARSLGLPAAQCRAAADGDLEQIGPWRIRVFAAAHDRLFGAVPIRGTRAQPGGPPVKASDWVVGEPLAFLIEAAGLRIYIEAGGLPERLPPGMKVDLAILGVALPDARRHFVPAISRLQPRFILPSHQDDFFQPFDRGFIFGKGTDFPAVLREWERACLPGRLILLDYFRPWTLR